MLFGVIFAIVFVVVMSLVMSDNRLVSMRNQALNGWRQIDVQLKRRHDLIPNFVNAVRGSMDFERDTLTAVGWRGRSRRSNRPRRRRSR